MQEPMGVSGVHAVPKTRQSVGFFTPRRIAPHSQALLSGTVRSAMRPLVEGLVAFHRGRKGGDRRVASRLQQGNLARAERGLVAEDAGADFRGGGARLAHPARESVEGVEGEEPGGLPAQQHALRPRMHERQQGRHVDGEIGVEQLAQRAALLGKDVDGRLAARQPRRVDEEPPGMSQASWSCIQNSGSVLK